jgi:hypothetical protein
MIAKVQADRTTKGLKLTWFIPDQKRTFTAFAKDEAQKQAWLREAQAEGWQLR